MAVETIDIRVIRNPQQTSVTETGPFSEGESTREWVRLFDFINEFLNRNKEIFDELARK
jgi:hypothetical protein